MRPPTALSPPLPSIRLALRAALPRLLPPPPTTRPLCSLPRVFPSTLLRPPPLSAPPSSVIVRASHASGRDDDDPSRRRPTLFDLPGLSRPSDFLPLAKAASRECDAARRELASSLHSSRDGAETAVSPAGVDVRSLRRARRTLRRLDDISNAVCGVIDAAELCRSVHASPEWRRAASDAFGMLSGYIGSLNADENLYRCLVEHVFEEAGQHDESGGGGVLLARMTPEERRMAVALRREFERDGIHLKHAKREEARELNDVVVGLETLFTNNITEQTKHYDVQGDHMVREVERVLPRHVLGQFLQPNKVAANTDNTNNKHSLTLSSDMLLTNTLLAHSPSAALRKEVYLQSHTSVPQNLKVLDALVKQRHLHSTLLGYPSYAHRVLSDRMAGTPEQVLKFLDGMKRRSEGKFREEMALIAQAKNSLEGGADEVRPWDVPYYASLIKAERQRNAADGDDEESLSGYFTVENSVDGMKVLVRELFGISMTEAAIPPEERWDVDLAGDDKDGCDERNLNNTGGLRKFEFYHDRDGPLGTMYFDLHPREGKFVHAAHFTIRCGRTRSDDDDDSNTEGGEGHQLPIVALVCNLSPSASSSSSGSATLVSHAEVETLFHEFGHGLHSLLSRTSFQHLSGTRGAMDFIETPSHLFETYARDPSFLSRVLARHYATGDHLSKNAARRLASSRKDFGLGIELRTQIVHSLFDQALFGPEPCSSALGGRTSTEAFDRLHAENDVPRAGPGEAHWHTRFGHLVTYGAGYYGYLYAQVFAADIWSSCFARNGGEGGGTTNPEGGAKIWREMLVHGGAKDPNEMLRTVLGREPNVEAFFRGQ